MAEPTDPAAIALDPIYGATADPAATPSPSTPPPSRRRGPDPVTLVVGLLALAAAVLVLTGAAPAVDLRWLLAAGAVGIGVALLVGGRRRGPTG